MYSKPAMNRLLGKTCSTPPTYCKLLEGGVGAGAEVGEAQQAVDCGDGDPVAPKIVLVRTHDAEQVRGGQGAVGSEEGVEVESLRTGEVAGDAPTTSHRPEDLVLPPEAS